jgi:hypothetical protein
MYCNSPSEYDVGSGFRAWNYTLTLNPNVLVTHTTRAWNYTLTLNPNVLPLWGQRGRERVREGGRALRQRPK